MVKYEKKCFLNVPLNAKGKIEHEYCDPPEMPNVWGITLLEDECCSLFRIFNE